jgi:hypothetical protein
MITFLLLFILLLSFKVELRARVYSLLLAGYSLVALIAYIFSFGLLYFSAAYLSSILFFNFFIFLRQFYSNSHKLSAAAVRSICVMLLLYSLTLLLFLINECYDDTPLNKVLQPYKLRERLLFVQDILSEN